MDNYAKLISETEIEYAPINKDGILNYNRNIPQMKKDGYKPLIPAVLPSGKQKFVIEYTEDETSIRETIRYLETEEECEKRIQAEEINIQIEKLNTQINELDIKRIRAICEPSIKDETTGETWLDYYNSQVAQIRKNIQDLKGTINDITE